MWYVFGIAIVSTITLKLELSCWTLSSVLVASPYFSRFKFSAAVGVGYSSACCGLIAISYFIASTFYASFFYCVNRWASLTILVVWQVRPAYFPACLRYVFGIAIVNTITFELELNSRTLACILVASPNFGRFKFSVTVGVGYSCTCSGLITISYFIASTFYASFFNRVDRRLILAILVIWQVRPAYFPACLRYVFGIAIVNTITFELELNSRTLACILVASPNFGRFKFSVTVGVGYSCTCSGLITISYFIASTFYASFFNRVDR